MAPRRRPHLGLAARAAWVAEDNAAEGMREGQPLRARQLQQSVVTEMRHNGTHLERVVHAKWQCTMPEGDCAKHHAPLEGLPDQMEKCTNETNEGPLIVNMAIDLTCAGMGATIPCGTPLPRRNFDPFQMCNTDPLLVKALCHLECRGKTPFEICRFEFDGGRRYNMSDETIDLCDMQATCKSPYVEQNEMFCSGHNTTKKHKADWVLQENPWSHRGTHGLSGPPPASAGAVVEVRPEYVDGSVPPALPQPEGGGAVGPLLWAAVVLLMLVAAALFGARLRILPTRLQRLLDALGLKFDMAGADAGGEARDVPRLGALYRPSRYVAPSAPHVLPPAPANAQWRPKQVFGAEEEETFELAAKPG